jgi:hypothetical protein
MNAAASVSATIMHSTISNNTAGASSGGLFINRGFIRSSTISVNTANGALATDGGGGLRIQAGANSVTLLSSTLTANTAPNAAAGARSGIWHETGTLVLMSSIVAANVAQDVQKEAAATLNNGGFNLIGENTSIAAEFPAGSPNGNNYVGTDAAPLDPMINPLSDNDGPTPTHAVQAGSIVIDKGFSFSNPVDQRNFRRVDFAGLPNSPGGDGADIGAHEFQTTPAAPVRISGQVTSSTGGAPISRAVITLTDSEGNIRTALTNPFGYYSFEGAGYGETYLITAGRKGFRPGVRTVTPQSDVEILLNLDPQ